MTSFDSKSSLIAVIFKEMEAIFHAENGNLELFVNQFFKRVPIEFLQKLQIPEMVAMVQDAWELFQIRLPNESFVKIKSFELSHHTFPRLGIYLMNLDQPFLIDSVTNFLEKNGLKIEMMVHPVLGVQRNEKGSLLSVVELKEAHPLTSLNLDSPTKHFDYLEIISNVEWNILEESDAKINRQSESIAFFQIKSNLDQKQVHYLQAEIYNLIHQVRNVVFDWTEMRSQLQTIRDHIETLPSTNDLNVFLERQDANKMLNWLERGHFVFLGSRYFSASGQLKGEKKSKSNGSAICLEAKPDSPFLGLFRDELFTNSDDLVPSFCRTLLAPNPKTHSLSQWPSLSISKTNVRSTVHRSSRIDSLEVIDRDHKGNPQGLFQFLGIFTKAAFSGSAFETPLVGRKVQKVFDRFGLAPQWHDGKTLVNIINSIPRDELFYLTEDEIFIICQNVLNMNDQNSLTLSIRPDLYGRHITVIVFLPREKYSIALKDRISLILQKKLKGSISSDNVLLGELDYARLIFVISFSEPSIVKFNQREIEKALLEAALSWEDHLERIINSRFDEEQSATLLARYQKVFSSVYIDEFMPDQAVTDISYFEKITDETPIDLYLYSHKNQKHLKLKIFHAHKSLSLSILLPILKNMGLQVIGETSYSIHNEGSVIWIHDFEVESIGAENWRENNESLISTFHHIWNGTVENDNLHQLILKEGLSVSQVTLIRAYLKFLTQIELPYSLVYMEETMVQYSKLTKRLVDLFELRFTLKRSKSVKFERTQLLNTIYTLLEKVDRLDHDRILRHVLNAIEATLRTTYFQSREFSKFNKQDYKEYMSFKFDCRLLEGLPHPVPLYEIFVYSARVEAVHLRGAKVARGGIRWSERPEDFRIEILGLMKAQTVKNAVIVPVGSKGGFVVKNQDKFTDPAQLKEEVITCYKIMMYGLLDITDNLVNGEIVHPEGVVCLDDDDPYLVVAADKGTSDFSDIANAISKEYNFWLDDAFASGGSEGYDHKKMGITARGTWESVMRHFREMKQNCQTMPFTAVGVGDMGGDVFGNGMLQSSKMRLLAAFNHQYIFLDPDPDFLKSFNERKRLFAKSNSSWEDYNPALISKGGGVFNRSAKSIHLSPECAKTFGVSKNEITPDDLIKHLLCLPVDLLYFGGIGTFVKASSETQLDVGDRTNNEIRVNAKSLNANIIAEGANLAMTQRARIEYALKGGRLNTDAIDNSGGVDCSDHEVNLKILFSSLGNTVSRAERNVLLKKMTNDVAQLVLADNYRQSQILSLMEVAKAESITVYQSLIRSFEAEIKLDRNLEALPDDESLEQRRTRNQGMTRPELSVLLAYAKISLYDKILNSPLPENPSYQGRFYSYFPKILQQRYEKGIKNHPLRREITATVLANEVINRVGPAFIYGIKQTCGISEIEIVEAFFLACEVLELNKLWNQIDLLDSLIIADVQTQVLADINQSLEQIILWFLRHPKVKSTHFASLHSLMSQLPDKLHGEQEQVYNIRNQGFTHLGISSEIAHVLSLIPIFPAMLDILFIGKQHRKLPLIAETYFLLSSKIQLDWLMIQTSQIRADSEWQRSARSILMDDLAQIQVKLANKVITENETTNIDVWIQKNKDKMHHIHLILSNLKSTGHSDLGMLSYAMRQLERLV